MDKIILEASKRKITGKKVKNLRLEGKIPAIMYGRDFEPTPIALDARSTTLTLRDTSDSAILTISLDGKEHAALVRDKQIDFIRGDILHLDFQVVSLTEKIRTTVRIELIGDAPVLEEFSAIIVSGLNEVEVEALPSDLPEGIQVDVSVLDTLDKALYVKDIAAIENVEILTDPEELIATSSVIKEEVEEEVVEELEGEEGVEPEVIEQGKQEDEEETEE